MKIPNENERKTLTTNIHTLVPELARRGVNLDADIVTSGREQGLNLARQQLGIHFRVNGRVGLGVARERARYHNRVHHHGGGGERDGDGRGGDYEDEGVDGTHI